MATNFKIQSYQEKNNLYLRLEGDFDGTSAFELIHTLRSTKNSGQIVINTNDLKKIFPFGSEVFKSNLFTLNGKTCRVVFTGRNKYRFMMDKEVNAE